MIKPCRVEFAESEVRFESPVLFGFNAIMCPLLAVLFVIVFFMVVGQEIRHSVTLSRTDPGSVIFIAVLFFLIALYIRTVFVGRMRAVFDARGVRFFVELFGTWFPVPLRMHTTPWSRWESIRLEGVDGGDLRLMLHSRVVVAGLSPDDTRAVYDRVIEWAHPSPGRRPTGAST